MNNIFSNCDGFQWDEGNLTKNWIKHDVNTSECEKAFFNKPIVVAESEKIMIKETWWFLLGKTDENRKLFMVFTIRKNKIRIISARDMSKKEREIYYEEYKKYTNLQ